MKLLKILSLLILSGLKTWAIPNTAIISGHIPFLKDSDEVVLTLTTYGEPFFTGDAKRVSCRVTDHRFYFEEKTSAVPVIFALVFKEKVRNQQHINDYMKLNFFYGLLKDGDQLTITADENGLNFSGPGSEKNLAIQHFAAYNKAYTKSIIGFSPKFAVQYFACQDTVANKSLRYLEDHRQSLDSNEYILLKAFAAAYHYNKSRYLSFMPDSLKKEATRALKASNLPEKQPFLPDDQLFRKGVLKYSDQLSNAIINKYIYDSCYTRGKAQDIKATYGYIVRNFKGPLMERMLVNLLFEHRDNNNGHLLLIEKALAILKDADFITILKNLRASRSEGVIAHDFSLPDATGKLHSLSDYKGKIAVLDFWFTGCGSCALLSPYLTRVEKAFKGKPVVFVSINLDRSKTLWINSIRAEKYTSPYAVNLNTEFQGFQHPVVSQYAVDACPTLILIDHKGKLMNNVVSPLEDEGRDLTRQINKAIEGI